MTTPLRPHQADAVRSALAIIQASPTSRCQVLMPCGTGKTRVGLAISEQARGVHSVVVLVPSLALVTQTLDSWEASATEPFQVLLVCSKADRGKDEAETDFGTRQRTTDAKEISRFVAESGRRLVVCTYQSAACLASLTFDLGLFDEAHRTAGREGKAFGFALSDDNIRITHRVFMTATPRIVRDDGEGDVCSMDDAETYGSVAFEMAFKEARSRGLLADYRIVFMGVSAADARAEIESDNSEDHGARMLATAVLVGKVGLVHGIRRTLSFHSSVKRADVFASMVQRVAPDCFAAHVSGVMDARERQGRVERLLSEGGLISSCRCMGEGVDIPGVDCVVIVDPRTSVIEIVQIFGRMVRLDPANPDKVATIIIPIVVPVASDAEVTDEEMREMAAGAFSKVRQTIAALQSIDSSITEEIRLTGAQNTVANGTATKDADRVHFAGFDSGLMARLGSAIHAVCSTIRPARTRRDNGLPVDGIRLGGPTQNRSIGRVPDRMWAEIRTKAEARGETLTNYGMRRLLEPELDENDTGLRRDNARLRRELAESQAKVAEMEGRISAVQHSIAVASGVPVAPRKRGRKPKA